MHKSFFCLRDQYRFYERYHADPTNRAIHVVFVPLIHLTALLLTCTVPWFDLGAVLSVIYVVYYFLLDIEIACLLAPYFFAMYSLTRFIWTAGFSLKIVPLALAVHVLAWTCQFLGHVLFEHNRPALVDSLVSSLLTAPLFVILEVIMWSGLAPSLKARIMDGSTVHKRRR